MDYLVIEPRTFSGAFEHSTTKPHVKESHDETPTPSTLMIEHLPFHLRLPKEEGMKLGLKTGADLLKNQSVNLGHPHTLHWLKKLLKKLTHNSVTQEHLASYTLLVAETAVRSVCCN